MFEDPHGFLLEDGTAVGKCYWPDGVEITTENSYFDTVIIDGKKIPRLRRLNYEEDCMTPLVEVR